MKKELLFENSVYWGDIPLDISNISNTKIKNIILENFVKKNFINNYNDISISNDEQIDRVMVYVKDHYKIYDTTFKLVRQNTFAQIYEKNEFSIKRNHADFLNLKESPNFTIMYCVEVNDEQDEIIIEFDCYKLKNQYFNCPLKKGRFFMWPSNLNYYSYQNRSDDLKVLLFSNCILV